MTHQMSPEFLNDVRRLVDAARGFLDNGDGNDDRFILLMEEHVSNLERQLAGQAD